MSQTIPTELLLEAYSQGVFPMGRSRRSQKIDWYEPEWRGVFPMDGFHLSKNMRRWLRNHPYETRIDHDFRGVMLACAERDSTWISDIIIDSYCELHRLGYAHSVEVYEDGQRTGGLYGVAMGGAFFGESMFQTLPDRAKVALYHCHQRLAERGFVLWDTQYFTPHLGTMGCIEIPQADYLVLLEKALAVSARFED